MVLAVLKKLPLFNTLVLWGGLFILPLFLDGFALSQLAIYVCYGLLAMSLALIWGQAGLLCLGQAIFFGLGAYAMSLSTLDMLPFISQGQQGFGLLLAIVLPMALAVLISLLLFNGNKLDGAFLGLVTLALAVVAERFFSHWHYAGGANGLFGVPGLMWGDEELPETTVYYLTVGVTALVALGLYRLKASSWGLLLKTIRDNESRSNHLGINTIAIKPLRLKC